MRSLKNLLFSLVLALLVFTAACSSDSPPPAEGGVIPAGTIVYAQLESTGTPVTMTLDLLTPVDWNGVEAIRVSDIITAAALGVDPSAYRIDFIANDGYSLLVKEGNPDWLPDWTAAAHMFLYWDAAGEYLKVGWEDDPSTSAFSSAFAIKYMNGGTVRLFDAGAITNDITTFAEATRQDDKGVLVNSGEQALLKGIVTLPSGVVAGLIVIQGDDGGIAVDVSGDAGLYNLGDELSVTGVLGQTAGLPVLTPATGGVTVESTGNTPPQARTAASVEDIGNTFEGMLVYLGGLSTADAWPAAGGIITVDDGGSATLAVHVPADATTAPADLSDFSLVGVVLQNDSDATDDLLDGFYVQLRSASDVDAPSPAASDTVYVTTPNGTTAVSFTSLTPVTVEFGSGAQSAYSLLGMVTDTALGPNLVNDKFTRDQALSVFGYRIVAPDGFDAKGYRFSMDEMALGWWLTTDGETYFDSESLQSGKFRLNGLSAIETKRIIEVEKDGEVVTVYLEDVNTRVIDIPESLGFQEYSGGPAYLLEDVVSQAFTQDGGFGGTYDQFAYNYDLVAADGWETLMTYGHDHFDMTWWIPSYMRTFNTDNGADPEDTDGDTSGVGNKGQSRIQMLKRIVLETPNPADFVDRGDGQMLTNPDVCVSCHASEPVSCSKCHQ